MFQSFDSKIFDASLYYFIKAFSEKEQKALIVPYDITYAQSMLRSTSEFDKQIYVGIGFEHGTDFDCDVLKWFTIRKLDMTYH